MAESLFCCPVCGAALTADPHAYLCPQGHAFDRAAKGYVNLLLANQKNSPEPGDDVESLRARHRFLSAGFYAPLAEQLGALAVLLCPDRPAVLDCCCGEGDYLRRLTSALQAAGKQVRTAGFDISRNGVKLAASRSNPTEFAVASIFRIPAADAQFDLALHCFAPFCEAELCRILKPGGSLLSVIPGRRHLFGLKEALYAQPYENDEQGEPVHALIQTDCVRVQGEISLNAAQTADLLAMTPYAYRTDPAAVQRLHDQPGLQTEIEFLIRVFRKPV